MDGGELYLIFTEPLERLALAYMVTGSVASSSYGEPRFTHDIDIVVALPPTLAHVFGSGFPTSDFYCPPPDALREEAAREQGGHFNLIHHESGFKADVYLAGCDPLHEWALARRLRVIVLRGRGLWMAPPEYVIARKLQFYADGEAERHVRDIRTMLEVSGDDIHHAELEEWIKRLGLEDVWDRVRG